MILQPRSWLRLWRNFLTRHCAAAAAKEAGIRVRQGELASATGRQIYHFRLCQDRLDERKAAALLRVRVLLSSGSRICGRVLTHLDTGVDGTVLDCLRVEQQFGSRGVHARLRMLTEYVNAEAKRRVPPQNRSMSAIPRQGVGYTCYTLLARARVVR